MGEGLVGRGRRRGLLLRPYNALELYGGPV